MFVGFAALFILESCAKDNPSRKLNGLLEGFIDITDNLDYHSLNAEARIIFEAARDSDFPLLINQTRNDGKEIDLGDNVLLSGNLPNNASIEVISGIVVTSASYLRRDSTFKQLYGNNVNLVIRNGNQQETISFYAPTAIQVNPVTTNGLDLSIPNLVSWNVDPQNPTEKIIARFRYYSGVIGDGTLLFDRAYILDDTLGGIDLSSYINKHGITNAKSVQINFLRGNARRYTSNGESAFVSVQSIDHHFYALRW